MPIRDTVATTYKYSWPRLGHYRDPFGLYSIVQIEITIVYSDSTLRYIQSFPLSTSLENAGMIHIKRDKDIWINKT